MNNTIMRACVAINTALAVFDILTHNWWWAAFSATVAVWCMLCIEEEN